MKKNIHAITIASNIKRLRASKNLAQSALAAIAGLKPGQIYKYEKGENIPGGENLQKLAQALGVTTAELSKMGGQKGGQKTGEIQEG